MTILSREQIAERGLVPAAGPAARQPNGIDLTLASAAPFTTAGAIGVDYVALPEPGPEVHGDTLILTPGAWLVTYGEEVRLPLDVVGFVYPRSSLLRMGATIAGAVWDAGFRGVGQSLLLVANPGGLLIERGARIAQLTFLKLDEPVAPGAGYSGRYQS